MSTAVAILRGCVSGAPVFVTYRRRFGPAPALWVGMLVVVCGYIGFRPGCSFHL